jgi:tetratricopeptide (TPR) repeat protein
LFAAFPQFYIIRIDNKLDEILDHIKQTQKEEISTERPPRRTAFVESETEDSDDNKRVIELRHDMPADNTKKELKTIYYKAKDDVAQLNALIGLLDLFDPLEDAPLDMIELCKSGIALTEKVGSDRFKAYFLAQKAFFLSFAYINEDMKMFFSIMASNLYGLSFVTEAQRQTTLGRLRRIQEEYSSAFDAALNLTAKSNDLQMLAGVLLLIGNAAGHRASAYRQIGVSDRYEYERNLCKRSLLLAKNIYVQIADEEGVANALHNLANQIRFFGEKEEALALVTQSIEIFKQTGNKILLQKAIWLEDAVRTGRIPDYVHGERRKESV